MVCSCLSSIVQVRAHADRGLISTHLVKDDTDHAHEQAKEYNCQAADQQQVLATGLLVDVGLVDIICHLCKCKSQL